MERLFRYIPEGLPEECWLWTGPTDRKDGYGSIKIDGVVYKAHRLAYELFTGDCPNVCCHRCMEFGALNNNPLCCNPAHIHSGTKKDNRLDQVKYREDTRCILTESQVQEIRRVWKAKQFKFGERKKFLAELAVEYGMTPKSLQGVIYGYDRRLPS